jgi:uncharacterized protein
MSPSWKALHGHLPVTIDPIQLAERGARLTGTLPVKSMSRLASTCLDGSGDVLVDLIFERGEGEDVLIMHGSLRANLRVTCQRCLEGMALELEAMPWFILIRPGARRDSIEAEPDTLIVDKPLSLITLAEDELLLALPMVPMHEASRCPAGRYIAAAEVNKMHSSKMRKQSQSPFSILSKLRKSR